MYSHKWGVEQNLYPNSGNVQKRVEIPSGAVRKSLPKQRKSAEKVENPTAAVRKSLPKQQKSAEKIEIPWACLLKISTQIAENREKGRDS